MFGRKGVKRVVAIETEETEALENEGFSLEELGSAYAMAIEQASSDVASINEFTLSLENVATTDAPAKDMQEEMLEAPDAIETDGVPVTPETILEAFELLRVTPCCRLVLTESAATAIERARVRFPPTPKNQPACVPRRDVEFL